MVLTPPPSVAVPHVSVGSRPPDAYRGFRLEGTRSIRELITHRQVLNGAAIERLARMLAAAFPPK